MTLFSDRSTWEEAEANIWSAHDAHSDRSASPQIAVPEGIAARVKRPCAKTILKDRTLSNAQFRPVTRPQWPVEPLTEDTPSTDVAAQSALDQLVCFTLGTRILTAQGDRPIETLQAGDLVVTRDHGLRPIRWIGHRTVSGRGAHAPIHFRPEPGSDEDGVMVSPLHRMLFTGGTVQMLYGTAEVLVAAKDLVDGRGVVTYPVDEVAYFHLMFTHHEVIYADGVASESFHATDAALTGLDAAAREAVFDEFPALRTAPGQHLEPVRKCLDAGGAQSLTDRVAEM